MMSWTDVAYFAIAMAAILTALWLGLYRRRRK